MTFTPLIRSTVFTGNAAIPSCHASTLVRLRDGKRLAAWFAGAYEKARDVGIYLSVCEQDRWSDPICLSVQQDIPHWNPVLFSPEGETVLLFYKSGYEIRDWRTYLRVSTDGGATWDEERELVPGDESGGRGPVKNPPVLTDDGILLAPSSTERGQWKPFIDRFDGEAWEKHSIPLPDDVNLIQPTLWQKKNGEISALMRSNAGWIYESHSTDGGMSWSEAVPTSMPNNNSGICAATLPDHTCLLCCNPVGDDWGARSPLSLYLYDGTDFTHLTDVATGEGEFSYPTLISWQEADGIHAALTYTDHRTSIVYAEYLLNP